MPTILLIAAALLGLIVGSFLNALSFRFNTGQRFFSPRGMGGRSRCMHCGHTLTTFDLVPVLSFVFLRGKCRYCGARISWQYPLVEVVAAALSVLVFLQVQEATPQLGGVASEFVFIFWFFVWMTLLFVVVYDIKHTIIPFSCTGLLLLLAMVALFVHLDTLQFVVPSIWILLAGPLVALPLFLLSLVSGGTWMGWGDSGLELSLGWLVASQVGLSAAITALCLAFWIGAAMGVLLLILSRARIFGYTIKSEIPFAPFLVLGALFTLFFHVDFFSTLSALFTY